MGIWALAFPLFQARNLPESVRKVIVACRVREWFIHRHGHGFPRPLDIHEATDIRLKNTPILDPGDGVSHRARASTYGPMADFGLG